MKWQWARGAALAFPGRLAEDRHVCNFSGICGVGGEFALMRSLAQWVVLRHASHGLSEDHRQSDTACSQAAATHFFTSKSGFVGASQVALEAKEPACQCRRLKEIWVDPWVRKIPWRRA